MHALGDARVCCDGGCGDTRVRRSGSGCSMQQPRAAREALQCGGFAAGCVTAPLPVVVLRCLRVWDEGGSAWEMSAGLAVLPPCWLLGLTSSFEQGVWLGRGWACRRRDQVRYGAPCEEGACEHVGIQVGWGTSVPRCIRFLAHSDACVSVVVWLEVSALVKDGPSRPS